MTTREQAMQWFNEKDTYNKSELSHKYHKDSVSYNFTALTGREIEEIWRKENKRAVYNNGFKTYYYKCENCYSENVKQVVSGGFSPPNLVCNDCKTEVINSPITIEYFGEKENKTENEVPQNIYLNRLKEQYYEVRRCLFPNEADYVRARYGGMREFCLDTQLVSFNDIELMEFEVNQSFS